MPSDWRKKIVVLFFAVQVALVVQARFVDTRYFCWAPHTSQARYELEVEIGGEALTGKEIRKRYRLRAFNRETRTGWEAHAIANLKALLAQYERSYGREEAARITLTYQVNGHAEEVWFWPPS